MRLRPTARRPPEPDSAAKRPAPSCDDRSAAHPYLMGMSASPSRGRPSIDLPQNAWDLALLQRQQGASVAHIQRDLLIKLGLLRSAEWLRLRLPPRRFQAENSHGR